MVKFVGKVELPGICLKYFVFGNRRQGYGIRIMEENEGHEECDSRFISRNLLKTLNLAYLLNRCSVFPANLCEILEDIRFSGVLVDGAEKVVPHYYEGRVKAQ